MKTSLLLLCLLVVASAANMNPSAAASLPPSLAWIEQTVTASDGAGDDRFGNALAVDGDTAVIGAFDAKVGDNYYQGAAYVLVRQNGTWSQVQKLVASDGAGMANFGSAVAIAGETILISATGANVGGNSLQGEVYVFRNIDGSWTQTQHFSSSDGGSGDSFGNAIALQGSLALIGAKGATVNGNALQGKAYVFANTDGVWSESQILAADDGAGNDLFGQSVALDGTTAIVGAPTFTYNFQHAGWAYVFTNSGGTWTQVHKLVPDDSALGDQFGYAVGLSGGIVLASTTGNPFAHGAAYVFTNDTDTWTQQQKLSPGDSASGDEFGNALAMSGSTAVIGAERIMLGEHQGAAYVFAESDGIWAQTDELTEDAGTSLDFFGGAIAFDGTTVLIGTPGATIDANQFQGSASFYRNDDGIFCAGFESGEGSSCAAAR